jgi:DNA-binding MarR family transcriptional regulator
MVTATVPPIALESLMNAARIFAATTVESVAPIGDTVTLPQLRILVLASTRPSVNNSDVAQALDVHLSSASRTCDRLVRSGLLSRQALPRDRRRVELILTCEGQKLVAEVTARRRATFNRILRQMSADDQTALSQALDVFVNLADEQAERVLLQL